MHKLKISSKLSIFLVIVFALTNITVHESRKINDQIININNPSVDVLEELNLLMVSSKMLIISWVVSRD